MSNLANNASKRRARRVGGDEHFARLESRTFFSTTLPANLGMSPAIPVVLSAPLITPKVVPSTTPVRGGYVPPPKLVTTRISITPTGMYLADGTSYKYTATAYDQNGKAMAPAPAFSWSVLGGGAGGSVTSAGLYTAPATATGATTLQATAGGVKATISVNVTAAGVLTADGDVGSPALSGHYSYNGTSYTVSGSGNDIWNASDQFNFASAPLTGDGLLETRVTSIGNTDPWAKAGLMFRESTAGTSRDVYLIETPQNIVQLLDRTTTGAVAVTAGQTTVAAGPLWLRLVRQNNAFTGFYSADGTNWSQVGGAVATNFNSTLSAGLVVSSHNVGTVSSSTFDNLSVSNQPTTGTYRLSAKLQPNLSLDVYGFGNANQTPVQLWNANYTSNQQWMVQGQGDGTFKIYAYSGANSFQMLDDAGGITADGNTVNTYSDNGTNNQRWLFVPTGGGYYRIVPKNAENTLQTLDIQNGSNAAAGSRTDIYTYGGGGNQQFLLSNPGTSQILVNSKKGVAGYLNEAASVHASWGYDWGSGGSGNISGGAEYDPMAWGYYGNANNGFSNFIGGLVSSGAKDLLSFNEPDNSGQSNLSVSSALEGYGLMANASKGVPLISPAATDATDSWMQQFMAGAAADGYRVDAVAIHWYGGNDPAGFINYVNAVHNLYNKPVWITEFCPADWSGNGGVSVAAATSFMEAVIPQLNAMSFVQRYSWFSAGTNDADLGQGALYNSDGSLTALGSVYSRM